LEERATPENFSKRIDVIVKAADKGVALVVWQADLYEKKGFEETFQHLVFAKVHKDLTSGNQQNC